MRWSVSLQTEGDREIQLEEVVELADAVAQHDGIATGMGTFSYGVQIVVEAETSDEAVERAQVVLTEAAVRVGLPVWPIVSVETIGDDEEMGWYDDVPEGNPL
ncbi:MAG TPA: hypothetical protein VJ858_04275 [Acidimicrobiia bacterium]|nr:hypothetical protein [Acidimicrobiia bacterium]